MTGEGWRLSLPTEAALFFASERHAKKLQLEGSTALPEELSDVSAAVGGARRVVVVYDLGRHEPDGLAAAVVAGMTAPHELAFLMPGGRSMWNRLSFGSVAKRPSRRVLCEALLKSGFTDIRVFEDDGYALIRGAAHRAIAPTTARSAFPSSTA